MGLTVGTWLLGELESLEHLNAVEKLEYSRQSPVHRLVFRFDALEEGQEVRMAIWQENLEDLPKSPVFGWGPAKSTQETITDNGYVLSLRRYGLVGLALFLLLYWQVLRFCRKLLRLYPYQSAMWATALSVISVTLAYLVANMSVEAFYQLQLMSFFWLMAGIGYSGLCFRSVLREEVTA
jgi:O-antigen ligase